MCYQIYISQSGKTNDNSYERCTLVNILLNMTSRFYETRYREFWVKRKQHRRCLRCKLSLILMLEVRNIVKLYYLLRWIGFVVLSDVLYGWYITDHLELFHGLLIWNSILAQNWNQINWKIFFLTDVFLKRFFSTFINFYFY